jgi:DNA-binding NarL/FixJ family response regulator
MNQSSVESIDPDEFAAAIDFGQTVGVLVELQRDDFESVAKLLRIGCAGVLDCNADIRLIRRAIRAVASGQLWVGRAVMSRLLRALLLNDKHKLTEREGEILHMIGEGLKNQEIAGRLFISSETVRWHLRSLYGKLGIRDRVAARMCALEMRYGPARQECVSGAIPAKGRVTPELRTAG